MTARRLAIVVLFVTLLFDVWWRGHTFAGTIRDKFGFAPWPEMPPSFSTWRTVTSATVRPGGSKDCFPNCSSPSSERYLTESIRQFGGPGRRFQEWSLVRRSRMRCGSSRM